MSPIPYYMAWDPGGSQVRRTIGQATWTEQADFINMRSLTEKEFDEEIENIPDSVRVFIIEKYIPFGHIPHTGNPLLTAQRIGDIKGYARRHKIKIVEQKSDILNIACLWAGIKREHNNKGKKLHLPDYQSAYAHGYYYLYNKGLIKPRVLDD